MISLSAFAISLLMQPPPGVIIIDEGDRPTSRAMTYYANCGSSKYEISARLGKTASKSITRLSVNGLTIRNSLVENRIEDSDIAGDISSVVIDKCKGNSARVRLQVLSATPFLTMHLFYFWVSPNGEISSVNGK